MPFTNTFITLPYCKEVSWIHHWGIRVERRHTPFLSPFVYLPQLVRSRIHCLVPPARRHNLGNWLSPGIILDYNWTVNILRIRHQVAASPQARNIGHYHIFWGTFLQSTTFCWSHWIQHEEFGPDESCDNLHSPCVSSGFEPKRDSTVLISRAHYWNNTGLHFGT